jgi:hypothetical protein
MPFTESETRIVNLALIRGGEKKITSLDEDSERARTMKTLYSIVRDEELTQHDWTFACARSTLARDGSDPDFEWTYQYVLPGDFLRARGLWNTVTDGKYVIEGTKLMTEETTVYLKYVKRVETTTQFDPLFVKALYLQLGVAGGERLTALRERKADLFAEYQQVIATAKRMNAITQNPPERAGNKPENHTWVSAGR